MTNPDDPAPPIPPELVDWLDRRFPERTPQRHESLDDIRAAAGQREVVNFLRFKLDVQNEDNLLNPS